MPGSKRPGPAFLALAVVVCAACSRSAPDLNGHAEALLQEARWDEAVVVLKQQLLRRPDDIAAHFYLGRCYLNAPRFYPGAAAGEFETALRLFSANGRISPIAEYDDEYFELRCHLELAKVYLRTYHEYAERGAPRGLLQRPLRKLKEAAAAAERITPDSDDVRDLKAIVDAM